MTGVWIVTTILAAVTLSIVSFVELFRMIWRHTSPTYSMTPFDCVTDHLTIHFAHVMYIFLCQISEIFLGNK